MTKRPTLEEPEDHADLDAQLLPLALDFSEGSAGDLLDIAQGRYEVHHFVVARWLWSAWHRGLIVELDPHYSAFHVVADRARERLRELEDRR